VTTVKTTMRSHVGNNATVKPRGTIVDLFCGAGGLSHGFYSEGFDIVGGIDIDEACRYAFEHNNDAPFIRQDVEKLSGREIQNLFIPDSPRILVGCAPCQPFSSYNQKNNDPKWKLLSHFGRLIDEVRPDIASMENVPRLLNFKGGTVFRQFIEQLEAAGYYVSWKVLYSPDFGLAQKRRRLVLLASRLGSISLPTPTHEDKYRTVMDEIGALPKINHGEADIADPLHCASRLSDINLRRITSSKPGGTWKDWDDNLLAACHKAETGRSYSSVYGRMRWEEPSPTITTQFFSFGTGRFGHPEQSRALSLREGALLQGFPRNYEFIRPGEKIQLKTIGRLIGNAVPVKLSAAIARAVKIHLESKQ